MARLTVNGVRRMIGNSLDSKKWKFIANPACCAKCAEMNGRVVSSPTRPSWSAHGGPAYDSMNNCKCHWIEVSSD